jgi:hypothetical protein
MTSHFKRIHPAVAFSLCIVLLDALFEPVFASQPSDYQGVELLSHRLTVQLIPEEHTLIATDRMTLGSQVPGIRQLSFSLNQALHVSQIRSDVGETPRPVSFTTELSVERADANLQQVTLHFDPPLTEGQHVTLEWTYAGSIHDPPREPRHLRFVTPSETAGHIGSEGVYLSGETHWYPDLGGSLPTYWVTATIPNGWLSVSHGKQISQTVDDRTTTSEWNVLARTEALTLVANRFVKHHRDWHGIEVATYLFPDDASLADEYLDASVRYLEVYTKLLGPYPFPKFAVVENFFASGLGMPSFTLLGSGVVKRHYVQPYALGHEIVHSWIGNWVFNKPNEGNWVEGLTTYLANYYYDELNGTVDSARAQRRMMLLGYAIYVGQDGDYPVGQFRHKIDQRDNAIGYQKAAMVFHMLRREIGDEAFWEGVRRLVSEYGGSFAGWRDLERIFAMTGGTNLRWFFIQWVEEAGAPSPRILEAKSLPIEGGGGFQIRARIVQERPGHRLRLQARVESAGNRIFMTTLRMDSVDQTFAWQVPAQPVELRIDADFETFRRLNRAHLPPMLNLLVTDRNRVILLPSHGSATDVSVYQELSSRIAAQEGNKSVIVGKDQDLLGPDGQISQEGSVLVLGGPDVNTAVDWAVSGCGQRVNLGAEQFTIDARAYKGPTMAVLVSCRRTDRPQQVVSIFYGLSPSAAAKVARLLFFYGWQSYVVFQDGAVVTRGDFSSGDSELEVHFRES